MVARYWVRLLKIDGEEYVVVRVRYVRVAFQRPVECSTRDFGQPIMRQVLITSRERERRLKIEERTARRAMRGAVASAMTGLRGYCGWVGCCSVASRILVLKLEVASEAGCSFPPVAMATQAIHRSS